MITVVRRSGRDAQTVRQARRKSMCASAARSVVRAASVTDWERRGEQIRLRGKTQKTLDRYVMRTSSDARERFEVALDGLTLDARDDLQPIVCAEGRRPKGRPGTHFSTTGSQPPRYCWPGARLTEDWAEQRWS